jgi:predicted RNase H-like HicB family nuclease
MATAPIELTAVYEPVEDGWVQASLVEWPAVITCARSREEAHDMLLDAFREMVLSYTDEDARPPVETSETEPIQLTIA